MTQLAEPIEPPAQTSPLDEARARGACLRCGAAGAKRVEFMRVMSFIAVTRHQRWESFLCPSCTAKIGAKELAISCALGWWGIPWGPIYTIQSLWVNFKGGKDVTQEVLVSMASAAQRTN